MLASSIVLGMLVLATLGAQASTLVALYIAAVSPALFVSDLESRRLPNRLVVPGYFVAASAIIVGWMSGESFTGVAILSGAAYGGGLLVLAALGGMGMGDVKLAGVLGFGAGALGLEVAGLSSLLAFAIGGVVALAALVAGADRNIPFGPCLLAGFWGAVLAL